MFGDVLAGTLMDSGLKYKYISILLHKKMNPGFMWKLKNVILDPRTFHPLLCILSWLASVFPFGTS